MVSGIIFGISGTKMEFSAGEWPPGSASVNCLLRLNCVCWIVSACGYSNLLHEYISKHNKYSEQWVLVVTLVCLRAGGLFGSVKDSEGVSAWEECRIPRNWHWSYLLDFTPPHYTILHHTPHYTAHHTTKKGNPIRCNSLVIWNCPGRIQGPPEPLASMIDLSVIISYLYVMTVVMTGGTYNMDG